MDRQREYIQRRNVTANRRYAQVSYGHAGHTRRKKTGPPAFFILVAVVVLAVVVGVVIWAVAGHGKQPDKTDKQTSSAGSEVSGSSGAPVSGDPAGDPASAPSSAAPVTQGTPPPENVPQGAAEQLGALLKVGDTGFEYYNFVESYAQQYISTICDAGTDFQGVATVYDLIIPTSMDITLPENFIVENEINSSNQDKAIDYMMESITYNNPSVVNVPLFDALKLHNNEYIYFRTDHHWTQLGAYYGYVEYCKAKGFTPVSLDSLEKRSFPGFLGSFYNDSPNDAMAANPDTVEAYYPPETVSMEYTDRDGNTYPWPLIADGDTYDTENLYLIFSAGDQPYEKVTNSAINDGSACIVLKESFGNVFVPFLTNHYQNVYVIDYRYYTGDLVQLARDTGAKDVLFVNNISMTRNEDLINDLASHF